MPIDRGMDRMEEEEGSVEFFQKSAGRFFFGEVQCEPAVLCPLLSRPDGPLRPVLIILLRCSDGDVACSSVCSQVCLLDRDTSC